MLAHSGKKCNRTFSNTMINLFPLAILGLSSLSFILVAVDVAAEFLDVRVCLRNDRGGNSDPEEKHFHKSTFHSHYDGRFAYKPIHRSGARLKHMTAPRADILFHHGRHRRRDVDCTWYPARLVVEPESLAVGFGPRCTSIGTKLETVGQVLQHDGVSLFLAGVCRRSKLSTGDKLTLQNWKHRGPVEHCRCPLNRHADRTLYRHHDRQSQPDGKS